jgi:hypothetical protein
MVLLTLQKSQRWRVPGVPRVLQTQGGADDSIFYKRLCIDGRAAGTGSTIRSISCDFEVTAAGIETEAPGAALAAQLAVAIVEGAQGAASFAEAGQRVADDETQASGTTFAKAEAVATCASTGRTVRAFFATSSQGEQS